MGRGKRAMERGKEGAGEERRKQRVGEEGGSGREEGGREREMERGGEESHVDSESLEGDVVDGDDLKHILREKTRKRRIEARIRKEAREEEEQQEEEERRGR
eukprot:752493-Hanusia_phi.AAC.1